MLRWPMMFSLFSLVLFGCAPSDYKALRPASHAECFSQFKPQPIQNSWYHASIDVVGKHLSGLLLIKTMADSSKRVVFTNETGVKFFDLEYLTDNSFRVSYIMPQLDRKALIGMLKSDFGLLLGIPFKTDAWVTSETAEEYFFGTLSDDKMFYFVTDKGCTSFHRLEYGSKRRRLLTVQLEGEDLKLPDAIIMQHHNFDMLIHLKRIIKS